MTWVWRLRQVSIIAAIAVSLLIASTVRELGNTLKLTLRSTAVEGQQVAESVMRQMTFLSEDAAEQSLEQIAQHHRVTETMLDAQVSAPSVVHVAIYDATGVILADTLPQRVGTLVEPAEPLPHPSSIPEALRVLWHLWRHPVDYTTEWPLVSDDDTPLAVIRVINASAFLLHDVREAFRRGALSIGVLVILAGLFGAVGGRATSRRLRELESTIVALREGRPRALPETGWNEFGRMAHELNLLGESVQDRLDSSDLTVRQSMDLLADGILIADASGTVVLGNSIAWDRLGIPPAPLRRLQDIFSADHPLVRMTQGLLQGDVSTLTEPLSDREGGLVAVGHRIREGDVPTGALVEIKVQNAEAELQGLVHQSRVLGRLGHMAAGVAHELRGPLQGLEFDLEGLERSLDDPPKARGILNELRQKIQRLEWVVTGFLKVARVRPLHLEPLSAPELARDVCESLETEAMMAGVSLRILPTDQELRVVADRDTLSRALENLLSNAIEAQPSRTREVLVECRRSEDAVEIEVRDTGPGIDADRHSEVFDLYFTTKPHGTGVGLALVRQAVDLHNGDVRFSSQPGRGTAVTMRLPTASLV